MNKSTPLLLLAALPLFACGSDPAAPSDKAGGSAFYMTTCTSCHGATGHGDGPGSKGLDPQPRDLSDPAWQDSVDDEYLRTIIRLGGAGAGKSPVMPANPQLNSNEALLNGVVDHVRSLRKAK